MNPAGSPEYSSAAASRTKSSSASPAAIPLSFPECGPARVFAAVGVYLFFHLAQVATGGPAMPLGRPLLRS